MFVSRSGVYKAIWHNSQSYMKTKTLKYRLRVLEKVVTPAESGEKVAIEDLFTVNDLNEREEQTYKMMRAIYPERVPIVRVVKNSTGLKQGNQCKCFIYLTKCCFIEQTIVLLIEENRSYLCINKEGA